MKVDRWHSTKPRITKVKITGLYTDLDQNGKHDEAKCTDIEKRKIWIYIPHGYPQYSTFYIAKSNSSRVTAYNIIDKLLSHMNIWEISS